MFYMNSKQYYIFLGIIDRKCINIQLCFMILKNLVSDELNWFTIYLRASMSSLLDLFVILDVEDHIFEFLKANYAGLFICMLVYYLFNLLFGDFSAEF